MNRVNKIKVFYQIGFLLCLIVIGYNSCTYHKEEQVAPLCSGVTPDSVSFSNDIIPIFTTNCAMSGCHEGSSPGGNLNLSAVSAYSQLSKKGSGYINVSNPTYSVLYSSLVSGSPPMPPSGSISSCDLQLIKNWMSQGGKNN
jgi:hypothetical protein